MSITSFSRGVFLPALFATIPLSWSYAIQEERTESSFRPNLTLTGRIAAKQSINGSLGAQLLAPLSLGEENTSELWYLHGHAHLNSTSVREIALGLGSGYRMRVDTEWQLGGYGLLEMRKTPQHTYWLFSPGVELSTEQYQLSLTGYLPLGTKQQVIEKKFAHELGIHTHHRFEKHQEFDYRYNVGEALPLGLDLNAQWWLNTQCSLSLGGYYIKYAEQTALPGLRAGVSYTPIPTLQLTFEGQHDRTASQLWAQVHVHLDTSSESSPDTQLRRPLQRPWVPMASHWEEKEILVRNYIDFYGPKGSDTGDGTFEKPYGLTIDQAKVTAMPGGATLYLAEGEKYTAKLPSGSDRLALSKPHSILGRSADFKSPAEKDKRPVLNFSLEITGKGTEEKPIHIQQLEIEAPIDEIFSQGILLSSAQHVHMRQIRIGRSEGRGVIREGIAIQQGQHIRLFDSEVFAERVLAMNGAQDISVVGNYGHYLGSYGSDVIQVSISGGSKITLQDNKFYVGRYQCIGLQLDSNPIDLTITNNRFEIRQASNAPGRYIGIKIGRNINLTGVRQNVFEFYMANNSSEIKTMDPNGKTLSLNNPHHTDAQQNKFTLQIVG